MQSSDINKVALDILSELYTRGKVWGAWEEGKDFETVFSPANQDEFSINYAKNAIRLAVEKECAEIEKQNLLLIAEIQSLRNRVAELEAKKEKTDKFFTVYYRAMSKMDINNTIGGLSKIISTGMLEYVASDRNL